MQPNMIQYFTDKEYDEFCSFIYNHAGINLTEKKKTLVANRLRKRVVKFNFSSYGEYFRWVMTRAGDQELINLINAITTNVSSFFRDVKQFQVLVNDVLPIIQQRNRGQLKIWSAGCSTGEEPYTISIVLNQISSVNSYEILASDLSTKVLEIAQAGVYSEEQLKDVDPDTIHKNFSVENNQYVIKPHLKKQIRFKRLNLIKDSFPAGFDIIFCRNVVIYFDRNTKNQLFERFWSSLLPHGYLFLGHSESLFNNSHFKFFKPSIYSKIHDE